MKHQRCLRNWIDYALLLLGIVSIAMFVSFSCSDYELLDGLEPDPVELSVVEIGDSTVALQWTQCLADDFRNYKVYFSTKDVVDTTQRLSDSLSFRQDTTKIVRNLEPNTLYYFRVIVMTNRGLISPSNTVEARTLVNTRGRIILFPPENITDTSVTLRWTPASNRGIKEYFVHMDTSMYVDSLDSLVARIYNDTARTIAPLLRNTGYFMKVYGKDDTGATVAQSDSIYFTTRTGFLDPVQLSIQSKTDTSVTLHWTECSDSGFGHYVIAYDTQEKIDSLKTLDPGESSVRLTKVNDRTTTVYTVTGLQRDTKYWFTVYTVGKNSLFVSSTIETAHTEKKAPGMVAISISSVTDTTVLLRWTENTEADLNKYIIYMDTTDLVNQDDTIIGEISKTGSRELLVTGLKPATQYWFVLFTENQSGLRSPSNIVVNYPIVLHNGAVTPHSIALNWSTAPSTAQFDYYTIFRDTLPSIGANSQTALRIPPAGISSYTTTTYTDTGLDSAVTYYYRIFYAENNENTAKNGNGSNEIMVKTE